MSGGSLRRDLFPAGLRRAAGLVLLLGLGGGPAVAAPDASASNAAMCRLECGAQFTEQAQNPLSVQTCLVRCAARAAAMGSANVTAATIMPTPQTPWTGSPHTGRAPASARPAATTAAQKARERQEAARAARAPATRTETAAAAAAPARTPATQLSFHSAPSSAPQAASPPAVASPSVFGSLIAAQAAPTGVRGAGPGQGAFGTVHLAPAPSRSYGLVVGATDRAAAHRAAEAACIGGTGPACRPAGDFTDRCASVAHALRSSGALMVTDHPSTFTVIAATIGTGPTREDAERQAAASCAQIGRGALCRITETRCAG